MIIQLLIVGIGAAVGGMIRYGFSNWLKNKWHTQFPWATFIINLSGSFLLGLLISSNLSPAWQLLFGTGLLGGYTTFSTFKIENIELLLKKEYQIFFSYTGLSYLFGLLFAAFGVIVGNNL
ncbi:fluoride efflux transporter CrcB [Listeria sp. PSOL-1]|uniref:fluoride efflux transporter CrcB n=1 Tax=Listeria sp. PSOL-1 TaxID=1844999 RepID=UPI0013D3346A|nr:fluoride efflux transporter CrcB [Listeria sp. PSOL-1]